MEVASIESATLSDASDDEKNEIDDEAANDEEVEAINTQQDKQQVENEGSVVESESTQAGSNPEPKSILRKKSKYEQADGEVTNRRVAELRNGSVASMALPGQQAAPVQRRGSVANHSVMSTSQA